MKTLTVDSGVPVPEAKKGMPKQIHEERPRREVRGRELRGVRCELMAREMKIGESVLVDTARDLDRLKRSISRNDGYYATRIEEGGGVRVWRVAERRDEEFAPGYSIEKVRAMKMGDGFWVGDKHQLTLFKKAITAQGWYYSTRRDLGGTIIKRVDMRDADR